MSASSKKKLRNENDSAKLTERQLAEQKEAKKLKLYTISFVAVLVVLVVVAVFTGVTRSIEASGVHEKNTVAATVGDHQITSAEMSYFYMDAINNFNSSYGSYAFLYGLDTSIPLDQQVINEETGETWADNFIAEAAASAQAVYALADAAAAEGFTLSEDQLLQVDMTSSNLDAYATIYGYPNADAFLKAQYGNGASKESYVAYYTRNVLASAYQTAHQDSLVYSAEDLRAADAENPVAYSSFSYNQYYLSTSKFLTGGTTADDGTVTYSDEEKQASVDAAKEAAEVLVAGEIATVEEFDAAIAALEVNADTAAASTAYSAQRQDAINTFLTEWVTDPAREAGDMAALPVSTTSTDDAGNEVVNTTAYYLVFFRGMDTNEVNLVNVRHILVSFTGDTNEDGSYTDEAKAAAKATAEEILALWQASEPSEDSFAALANERSTDSGSNTNGGLYENVYPGQMVASFNDWCFDESRASGDTGIVETEYGYHIMYYVSAAEQTYRDYMIENALVNQDMQTWYTSLLETCPITMGDTQYIKKDVIVAR